MAIVEQTRGERFYKRLTIKQKDDVQLELAILDD